MLVGAWFPHLIEFPHIGDCSKRDEVFAGIAFDREPAAVPLPAEPGHRIPP